MTTVDCPFRLPKSDHGFLMVNHRICFAKHLHRGQFHGRFCPSKISCHLVKSLLPARHALWRTPRWFLNYFFCICVCVSALTMHMHQVMSLRYCATTATSTVEATGSLQAQMILCCLDSEKLLGSKATAVLVRSGS